MLILLAACDSFGGGAGAIDTSALWVAEEGRFQVYRYLAPGALDETTDTGAMGDTLLQTLYTTGGCADGDGWRVERRIGSVWETSTAAGALHFDASAGLSICGYEEAGGALESLDPAVTLWGGEIIRDGDVLASGDSSVTIGREDGIVTYYGVFPSAISFSVAGGAGAIEQVLHLAPDSGIVVMENADFAADLVYSR